MKRLDVIISKQSKDAISDWEVVSWYENLKSGETVNVATLVMFNELRAGVALGEIQPFKFIYEDVELEVQKDGQLTPYWPEGFFDQTIIQMDMMMYKLQRTEARQANKPEKPS